MSEWRFPGKPVALKPRLLVNTNDAAIKAATDGFGITRVLSYQIKDELSKGRLKILLENYEPAPRPVHIVHREGRLAAIKVRAFVDLLVERLSQDKSLN